MSKINLESLLNNSSFSFYFLVVDQFLDIEVYPNLKNFHLIYAFKNSKLKKLKKDNIPYFCLEEQGVKLNEKNSGKLLSHPQVIDYINSTTNNLNPAIIPFKPSAKIDFLCQKHHWINISNPGPINRFLEDKIKFAKLCQKYHLPILPFSVDTFTQKNFFKYQKKFSHQLVIQTHFGWAGNSTFLSTSWDLIKDKIPLKTIVKYSPLIESSYSLLNNCCLTHQGLLQSPPALQYTGIYPLTTNRFTTVGRQWPSFAPNSVINKIKRISLKCSHILKQIGYKGYFGLDFLVNQNQVYLLECNPRLTASFAFYTHLEQKQKLNPLFYFHLAEFIKLKYHFNIKSEQKRFKTKISGSEITPKDKHNHTHNKLNFDHPLSKSTNPISFPPKIIDQLNEKI